MPCWPVATKLMPGRSDVQAPGQCDCTKQAQASGILHASGDEQRFVKKSNRFTRFSGDAKLSAPGVASTPSTATAKPRLLCRACLEQCSGWATSVFSNSIVFPARMIALAWLAPKAVFYILLHAASSEMRPDMTLPFHKHRNSAQLPLSVTPCQGKRCADGQMGLYGAA